MHTTRFAVATLVLELMAGVCAGKALAQPVPNQPISLSHFEVTATDMDAQKRFWVATLGGKPGSVVPAGAPGSHPFHVAFPGVLIEITPGKTTGGTKGSTVDHMALQVRNLRRMVDAVKQAGYPIVTAGEMPAGGTVKEDIGNLPGHGRAVAYVLGPDDVKVELLENSAMQGPIAFDHLHFMAPAGQRSQMVEWYKNAVGAADGAQGSWYAALDMPGLKGALIFSETNGPVTGTEGRSIGHIGFEVKDLGRAYADLSKRMPGLPAITTYPPNVQFTSTHDPYGTDVQFAEHPSGLFFESR